MHKIRQVVFLACFVWGVCALTCFYASAAVASGKVILLISEQNIESPQKAWWASQVDLSATEAVLAQRLIDSGYEVVEPSSASKILKANPAYSMVELTPEKSVKLADAAKADFVVLGKAVASGGSPVPQSNMRSCFATVSAKIIRVKDAKVIAYLDGSGNSVHVDLISGGKEALTGAASELAAKIISTLSSGGK